MAMTVPTTSPFNSSQHNIFRDARIPEDTIHVSSNVVVVEIGGCPVGLLQALAIDEQIEEIPLFEIGSPVCPDFSVGKMVVSVAGKFIISNNSPFYEGHFIPKRVEQLVVQNMAGVGFDISIYPKIAQLSDREVTGFDRISTPLIKIVGCRFTGASVKVEGNKPITTDFKAVAQVSLKDLTGLTTVADQLSDNV